MKRSNGGDESRGCGARQDRAGVARVEAETIQGLDQGTRRLLHVAFDGASRLFESAHREKRLHQERKSHAAKEGEQHNPNGIRGC